MTDARPRLHHAPSSYYSMIARLALAEAGIAWEGVAMDIHARLEQQAPAYAQLNPNMTVPTLVLPGQVLDQSRAIAEWALGAPGPEGAAWLDLHSAFPIEELTFGRLMARNPLARHMAPKRLAAAHRNLLRLAEAEPALRDLYTQRAAVFEARIRTFGPAHAAALGESRTAEALALLDRLEAALADGRATLEAGRFGAADAAWVVFLARIAFTGLADGIAARPAVARWWAAAQARPAFAQADIWTRFHPLRLLRGLLRL